MHRYVLGREFESRQFCSKQFVRNESSSSREPIVSYNAVKTYNASAVKTYNASAVKTYNATSSLNKNTFF
jgi:hypothetical protein